MGLSDISGLMNWEDAADTLAGNEATPKGIRAMVAGVKGYDHLRNIDERSNLINDLSLSTDCIMVSNTTAKLEICWVQPKREHKKRPMCKADCSHHPLKWQLIQIFRFAEVAMR